MRYEGNTYISEVGNLSLDIKATELSCGTMTQPLVGFIFYNTATRLILAEESFDMTLFGRIS